VTAQELLERLNLLDENERIEAKRADEVGKSLLETVCAFANEPGLGGGWLLLGVTREELALFPAYEIQGLDHPDKISADLASQAASIFNRPLRLNIQAEVLDGKAVIAVFVPEAAPQDKPLYLKAQGLPRGAFRRIGSTDQHCSEDDLIALYQGRQHESFDAGLVPDGTLDDFSPEALADYRQSRRDTNPDAEELRWSDEDLLQALGCVRLNADGKWQPTVAGLILFGKPVALRRTFPMTRVDYIRVPGREWVPDPERRFDSLELRDPLFRLIRRVQAAILDDLPKAFGLAEGDLQRKDSPIVPQRVIREAVVNALMHRSCQPTGKMLGDDDSLSSNPEGLSSNPLSLSRDLGALSRDPNSLDKAEAERKTKLRQTLLAGLPGELAARVGALGRRSPPDAVRDVVLDLLHQRPWRLEELGQLLQRNPEYVRQKYVQPLLEAARIRMTRPEVPNDPEQAYRVVEERP
jgi:predicted HTH transcriptional regulator